MTAADILSGEIVAIDRALDRANTALRTLGDAAGSALLKRVRGLFENAILAHRAKCQSLRQRIEGGASVEAGWSELAAIELETSDLLRECLAFMEGALVRHGGFDGGMCALADSMLDDLSSKSDLGWQRFTLVAAGEFYSTVSGIVRLRFTDTDIWNLPVSVHEFGHFAAAAPRFGDFEAMTAREKAVDLRYESHLRELFSDVLATYALGPSFAMACALLRFNPATGESKTHPSSAQRVWCMLQTLAKMDETEGDAMFAPIAARIGQNWSAALKAGGQSETLSDAELKRLRPWFFELYDLVNAHAPALRYRTILRAQEMHSALRQGQTPALRDDDGIPDILNAAWIYRLNMGSFNAFELDQIGSGALEMCESIAYRA
jgi:hypothetical protein